MGRRIKYLNPKTRGTRGFQSLGAHLCTLGGGGTHGPAQDLLDDIWQQADRDEQDDAEPGRAAGQHLHEHVVHPLVVQEGPEQGGGESSHTVLT